VTDWKKNFFPPRFFASLWRCCRFFAERNRRAERIVVRSNGPTQLY
jgi:hypothetical protein